MDAWGRREGNMGMWTSFLEERRVGGRVSDRHKKYSRDAQRARMTRCQARGEGGERGAPRVSMGKAHMSPAYMPSEATIRASPEMASSSETVLEAPLSAAVSLRLRTAVAIVRAPRGARGTRRADARGEEWERRREGLEEEEEEEGERDQRRERVVRCAWVCAWERGAARAESAGKGRRRLRAFIVHQRQLFLSSRAKSTPHRTPPPSHVYPHHVRLSRKATYAGVPIGRGGAV